MRPPSRWLAPGAWTALPPPPRPSGGGARGTEGPPHSPPPPTQAQERTEADGRNGGPAPPPKRPLHPGCGGTTAKAGARTPCPLPADGGPAAPRTAQTERPYQRPARGRRGREPGRGGSPPLPPPPPAHWPIGGRPDRARLPRPPGNPHGTCIPRGGRRQRMAGRRPTGRGGGGAAPPTPPPLPPPAWGPQERPSASPEPKGRPPPPPPQKGPRRGGGGGAAGPAHRAPQRPQLPAPAGVAAAGRAHTSVPEQRAHQAWGRRTAAHQNSMEAAPYMTLP